MGTFSPVFFRGNLGSALVVTLTAGARSATTFAAPVNIAVGDHLICCKSDWTEAEYLGKVTSIVGTTISFQWPARSTRNTGTYTFYLTNPVTVWQATSVPGTGGITPTWNSGIEVLETAGKQHLLTQVREDRDYVEILYKDAMAADFYAFKSWIQSELQGGLYQFGCAYYDDEAGRSRCDLVKFRTIDQVRASMAARMLRSWAVDLLVVQRDEIVPS